jgi:predicted amidohydrolase YtcJ
MTINGAWILKEENTKGTLEQGKLADLVIVDKNPLKVTPTEFPNVRVLETIKEGKTVYVNDGSAAVDPMPAIAENGDYLSLHAHPW